MSAALGGEAIEQDTALGIAGRDHAGVGETERSYATADGFEGATAVSVAASVPLSGFRRRLGRRSSARANPTWIEILATRGSA